MKKIIVVIARGKCGRTYISNTAVGIYDHGIYTLLEPCGWTTCHTPAAAAVYEALTLQLSVDKIMPVGFFTTTPIEQAIAIANEVLRTTTTETTA